MVFSSLIFLCIFLPTVFILHSVIPNVKVRNGLLILASLLFYAYGEPVYVLLLILSSLGNYGAALLIGKSGKRGSGKAVLALSVIFNLALLGVFKYTGFLTQSMNDLFGLALPVPSISLPIGISFFTFQAMSYVIDVYRGQVEVQKNYFKILLYISFFPQLIAGPIVKYRDIARQIDARKVTSEKALQGLRRFVGGLGKKVLIANAMGAAADVIFTAELTSINAAAAWLGAIAYLFQIYYDFSAYSDMAIGLGKMFGFDFLENFTYPYGAYNMKEFWRRWHISLSSWFKEYLYIPLGGNRKGKARTIINKIIVFFCTGLWHGANWTFVLWGLFHGFFQLLEDLIPGIRKLPRVIGSIYTLLVVTVGFVLFRADTIGQGCYVIGQMFTGFTAAGDSMSLVMTQLTPWFLTMLAAAIIGMAPIRPVTEALRKVLDPNNHSTAVKNQVIRVVMDILMLALLFWCMIRLSSGTYNPFIYFRF